MPAILVVDDDRAVLDLIGFLLSRNGYEVLSASGVPGALRAFAEVEGRIDLLVTDVVMPVTDGPTLAAYLREFRSDLPVLFISGFSDQAEQIKYLHAPLLEKPFSPQSLLRAVNAALAGHSARPMAALSWEELRQKSAEIVHACTKLALRLEGLDEHSEAARCRARKLLGQE